MNKQAQVFVNDVAVGRINKARGMGTTYDQLLGFQPRLRAPSEIGFTPLAVAVAKERLAHDFRQIQLKQRNIIEFMILTGGRRL